jgi:hypothetical protein
MPQEIRIWAKIEFKEMVTLLEMLKLTTSPIFVTVNDDETKLLAKFPTFKHPIPGSCYRNFGFQIQMLIRFLIFIIFRKE